MKRSLLLTTGLSMGLTIGRCVAYSMVLSSYFMGLDITPEVSKTQQTMLHYDNVFTTSPFNANNVIDLHHKNANLWKPDIDVQMTLHCYLSATS